MSVDGHDREAVAALALGALQGNERRVTEDHVSGCEDCRREYTVLAETAAVLAEVPAEALLDGPPDGDLPLQRALREIRRESRGQQRRRTTLAAAAAAVVVAAALGGGVLIGRTSPGPDDSSGGGSGGAAPPVSGTRVASAVDPATGARLTVRVVPAPGWVRVTAAVSGIPAGQACRLWVADRRGGRVLAGSWLVSAKGAREGTTLDGSALIDPADVTAVEVDTTTGRRYVSVPL